MFQTICRATRKYFVVPSHTLQKNSNQVSSTEIFCVHATIPTYIGLCGHRTQFARHNLSRWYSHWCISKRKIYEHVDLCHVESLHEIGQNLYVLKNAILKILQNITLQRFESPTVEEAQQRQQDRRDLTNDYESRLHALLESKKKKKPKAHGATLEREPQVPQQ